MIDFRELHFPRLFMTAAVAWAGAAVPLEAQTVRPLVPAFDSIEQALDQPQGHFFWIERRGGAYRLGDPESHFNGGDDLKLASFDISNNEVLANVGVQGTIERMSVYRDTYRVNSHPGLRGGTGPTGGTSGVWTAKDNSTYGPYSYQLVLDGESHDLASVDWDFRTGLLDNLFPVTEMKDPKGRIDIKLIAYAPMSADGTARLRGLIYGLRLKNLSDAIAQGEVETPRLSFPNRKESVPRDAHDPFDFDLALGNAAGFCRTIPFRLRKGETLWVPTVIFPLGDPAPATIRRDGALAWLRETWRYYRGLLGRLETPAHPFLAEFYEREVIGALQSIAWSESGKFAGTNWGSSPTTREIWTKDCYYSCLPFISLDPALARNLIPWFDEFGVRPRSAEAEGGINHSTSLTVASSLLAGLYYDRTGDRAFFLDHPELRKSWGKVLDAVVASRVDANVWLFPSRWVSDGPIMGDYHTGSNVAVWRALKGYARLLAEVYGDPAGAQNYRRIADKVRQSIMDKTVIAGADGPQFIDETYRDGRPPSMVSNGEESDVTLMPYYGFLPYDQGEYLNFMRFSVSPRNADYNSRLHSIVWREKVPSTAPGYLKGICAGLNEEEEFGEHGYYTELRRLTDLDGSVWWWSYGRDDHPVYPRLTRAYAGKSGWTAGVHSVLFPSRFLGIDYDAPSRRFSFAPLAMTGDFSWADFPEGRDHFSVSLRRAGENLQVGFTNQNAEPVTFAAELPVAARGEGVTINGKSRAKAEAGHYLGHRTIRFEAGVGGGQTLNVVVAHEEGTSAGPSESPPGDEVLASSPAEMNTP